MIIREFKVGQEVLVIRDREEFVGGKDNKEPSVPRGWKASVIKKRPSKDNFAYIYDLQGEDGSISTGYPSFCLMENLPGMQEVINRIGHLIVGTNDENEQRDLDNAVTYLLKSGYDSSRALMAIAYYLGKTAGIREERRRKKTLSGEKI